MAYPTEPCQTSRKVRKSTKESCRLTFKYPDLFPTLNYCKNAVTRKKVFIENENKCNQNAPLLKEAVVLRDEAARLLGYPNHAAFRIEDKMAKTPETVDDFLGDLRTRLAEVGAKERNTLAELKKKDVESRGEPFDGHYFTWDHRFYDRLQVEQDYHVDQEKISEFFPIQTTLAGMLEIFEQLLGLVFVEVVGDDRAAISPSGKGDDIVWHPDVQIFSVWDEEAEGGGFVGYLYTDLHPREGKYAFPERLSELFRTDLCCQVRPCSQFQHATGLHHREWYTQIPSYSTGLQLQQADAQETQPSQARRSRHTLPWWVGIQIVPNFAGTNVRAELGHGIHDLVGRTQYSRFHGTNTVQDFVEAPSQMLENWCWTPAPLKALSHHYSTLSDDYLTAWKETAKDAPQPPEKIPDELIDNIINSKHVNDGLYNLRQLYFGIFDMTLHEPKSHEEIEKTDCTILYKSASDRHHRARRA